MLHFRVLPQEDDRLSKGDRMGEIPGGFPLPLSVWHLLQFAHLAKKK